MRHRLAWLSAYIVVLGFISRPAEASQSPPCCPFFTLDLQCVAFQSPCYFGNESWYVLSRQEDGVGYYNLSEYEADCAWVNNLGFAFSMACAA